MKAFLILLLTTISLSAQKKIYYDNKGKEVSDIETAAFYDVIEPEGDLTKVTRFTNLSKKLFVYRFSDFENLIYDGITEMYGPADVLKETITYKNGKRNGNYTTYGEDGRIKCIANYIDNKEKEIKCSDDPGNEVQSAIETAPQYPGGMHALYQYVADNFKRKGPASGTIMLTFVVEKDGSITEIKVVKGINPKLDKEAIRVVGGLSAFTPGEQNGRKVRALYHLPIKLAE